MRHVQGGKEAKEKNAQAQISQAQKAHETQPQIKAVKHRIESMALVEKD